MVLGMVAGVPAGVTAMENAMSIFPATKPGAVGGKFRIGMMASCIGLLALNAPAFGTPAHKRNNAAVRPSATALVAHPSVGTKPPLFGWPTLVTEARKYIGTNPTDRKRLWCATFLNLVLAKSGYAGTGSDAAKSFASYGKRVSEPTIGAIAVLTRGKRGGHVGIVTGIDANGNPIIISGNHGHRVGEATYPRQRVIAYVMPTGRAPLTRLASAGPATPLRASDADHEGGFSSPIDELLAAINAERSNGQRSQAMQAAARQAGRPSAAARRAATPQVRPYRVVQRMPATEAAPRHPSYRAPDRAEMTNPPLPRQRLAVRVAPIPRSRPQAN
jgi:uncharacterized protein (TIGR02594 family)